MLVSTRQDKELSTEEYGLHRGNGAGRRIRERRARVLDPGVEDHAATDTETVHDRKPDRQLRNTERKLRIRHAGRANERERGGLGSREGIPVSETLSCDRGGERATPRLVDRLLTV